MEFLKLFLPAILLVISTQANSAIVTFTDRSAFQTAAGTTATEDFNTAPIGNFVDTATFSGLFDDGLDFDDFTLSSTDPLLGRISIGTYTFVSGTVPFNIDGTNFIVASKDIGNILTFNFNTAITAFGFNQNNYFKPIPSGFFGLNMDAITLDGVSFFINNPSDFFGFISDTPFNSIQFNAFTLSFAGENYGLDNVEYSVSAVPVPAAAWFFGTALFGFLGFSRKNKGGGDVWKHK